MERDYSLFYDANYFSDLIYAANAGSERTCFSPQQPSPLEDVSFGARTPPCSTSPFYVNTCCSKQIIFKISGRFHNFQVISLSFRL